MMGLQSVSLRFLPLYSTQCRFTSGSRIVVVDQLTAEFTFQEGVYGLLISVRERLGYVCKQVKTLIA